MFDAPASLAGGAADYVSCLRPEPPAARFLVVEDDPAVSRVLTRTLRARGFAADLASTPEEALALALARSEPPAYVILELKVAGRSTLPLLRPLREAAPAARICIVTAYASVATAVEAIKLGACDYLPKPAPLEDILLRLGITPAIAGGHGERRPGASRGPRPHAVHESRFALGEIEWRHILRTLRECDGNVTEAARRLKMHRRTLHRKIAAHGAAESAAALARMRDGGTQRPRLSASAAHTAAAGAAPVPLAA